MEFPESKKVAYANEKFLAFSQAEYVIDTF
jgi:hypothetical protein